MTQFQNYQGLHYDLIINNGAWSAPLQQIVIGGVLGVTSLVHQIKAEVI